MFNGFISKLKESVISVLPVLLIVLILSFTPYLSFNLTYYITFIVCSVFLIFGIALFNLGADMAMTPIGEGVGSGLTKKKNTLLLVVVCFVMGVAITIAEPDLSILAAKIKSIKSIIFISIVGLGVGLFLVIGVFKIISKTNATSILIFSYALVFSITCIILNVSFESNSEIANAIPLIFDSSGVTTGPITVPFIMALGLGIASTVGGRDANENSFGLVALSSVGPIIAVALMVLCVNQPLSVTNDPSSYALDISIANILNKLKEQTSGVLLVIGIVIFFFIVLQFFVLHFSKSKIVKISIGLLYTCTGLIIFLTAVCVGYEPIGYYIGNSLAQSGLDWLVILFGFVIGFVVVLAEPAVQVLNRQVENVTRGKVSRKTMMISLCIGVGISIGLSMIRIIFNFSVLYYLVPGFMLSLGLSFFVPKLYTAIAFDSGGVASGPLTSSFILPMAIGVCSGFADSANLNNAILTDAFGIVAMVAMTPLITIQLLGFKAIISEKVARNIETKRILDADDEQIIYFN